MTEREWLECVEPGKMLEFVRGKASDRKLRLFAVACGRSVQHLTSLREVAELLAEFIEGTVDPQTYESTKAWHQPLEPGTIHRFGGRPNASCAALLSDDAWEAATSAAGSAAGDAEVAYYQQHKNERDFEIQLLGEQRRIAFASQAKALLDVIGNPFRPATVDPAWRTPTVVSVATAIYDDRAFDRLPILADALEDAGCTNADILNHCRQPREHVRGCWAVDLVLGKT